MTSWGPGLRANDAAVEAITAVEEYLDSTEPDKYVKHQTLDSIFKIAARHDTDSCRCGTLGVAEWLLDYGVSVYPYKVVHEALMFELRDEQLSKFPNIKERQEVLGLFAKRMFADLTPDEAKKVRESNEGLFTRMLKLYHK